MNIQMPGFHQNLYRLGALSLVAGIIGACFFKEKIVSLAKASISTEERQSVVRFQPLKDKQIKVNPSSGLHLELFFDVNQSVIPNDSMKGDISLEQMTIAALAASVKGTWDGKHREKMSWEDYVYTVLVPDSSFADDSEKLKSERKKIIYGFIDWLTANKHPLREEVLKKYDQIIKQSIDQVTKQVKFKVFDSFYKLLEKLRKCQITFTVILISFGKDLGTVAQEIGDHPHGVKFNYSGRFEQKKLILNTGEVLEKVDDIFKRFLCAENHFALHVDGEEWHRNGKKRELAKPILCDSTGRQYGVRNLSLAYDDNITHKKDKDIVNPIDVTGQSFSGNSIDHQLIKVDTAEAQLDDKYFINKTAEALEGSGYIEESRRLKAV